MTTTLPDFLVTVDRAQHTVIDLVDENSDVVRTIDFGISGDVANAVNAWLDLEDAAVREALAGAMNALLMGHFELAASR